MDQLFKINSDCILYVDDQRENLLLFELMFSEKYNIMYSSNPIIALDLVKNNPVKVVISDYNMPEMNGLELLEILKKDFPAITRIMLTANTDYELEMEAKIRCDLFEFFTKPINMNKIEKTINKALLTTEQIFN